VAARALVELCGKPFTPNERPREALAEALAESERSRDRVPHASGDQRFEPGGHRRAQLARESARIHALRHGLRAYRYEPLLEETREQRSDARRGDPDSPRRVRDESERRLDDPAEVSRVHALNEGRTVPCSRGALALPTKRASEQRTRHFHAPGRQPRGPKRHGGAATERRADAEFSARKLPVRPSTGLHAHASSFNR
jgi:hypothetical protein